MKMSQQNAVLILFSITLLMGCNKKEAAQSSTQETRTLNPAVAPQLPAANKNLANEERVQRTMQMPKQKHPQIITSPDKPNPIGERLIKELSSLRPDGKQYTEKIRELWNQNLRKLSDAPLQSASDDLIAKGNFLPIELNQVRQLDRTQVTPEASLLFIVFASLASGQDSILHEFAKQRANVLPPTTADLAIYDALSAGIGEFTTTRGQSSYTSFEKWEPFANAANPIYRLLALKAAPVAVTKPAWEVDIDSKEFNRINELPKMNFYLSYLNEKDPIILSKAIRSLSFVPLPEARQAIENFHAQQLKKGDTVLIQAAEQALKTQKLIFP